MNRFLATFALAAFVAPLPAHASSASTHFWKSWPTFYANPNMTAVWKDQNTMIQATVGDFNENSSAAYLMLADDNDTDTIVGNNENEYNMTGSTADLCGTGADGCAWNRPDTTDLTKRVESDIFFDAWVMWDFDYKSTDTYEYGGGERPLATTAMHEFGHAMGLEHENSIYNIMGTDFEYMTTNGTSYSVRLGEDGTAGLKKNYTSATGYEDLAVSHWMYSDADCYTYSVGWELKTVCSAYSDHMRTRMFDSRGAELAVTWSADEPTYWTSKSTRIKVEVTVENNGSSSQTSNLKMLICPTSTVSSSCTTLTTTSVTETPDAPNLRSQWITMPSTVKIGETWYIGAWIDSSKSLTETDETNNFTYLAAVKIK